MKNNLIIEHTKFWRDLLMTLKLAINGFGRIGRVVFREALKSEEIEVVAVNDLTDPEMLAHLLKYDSVHGVFDGEVSADGEYLVVNGKKVRVYEERDPAALPWGELDVDVVVESTGIFTSPEALNKHIEAGAKKVILSAPAKGDVTTLVMGVNHEDYNAETDKVVSNASCTTNCLAPLVKVLNDKFGVKRGLMTTFTHTRTIKVFLTSHMRISDVHVQQLNQ